MKAIADELQEMVKFEWWGSAALELARPQKPGRSQGLTLYQYLTWEM
jgi:hypothetical protein